MRSAPPTAAELTTLVEDLLAHPGTDVPDDCGLDDDTAAAIGRVWAAGSNASPSLLAAARHELEMQLDGTHAREAMDRQAATFNDVLAEQDSPQP